MYQERHTVQLVPNGYRDIALAPVAPHVPNDRARFAFLQHEQQMPGVTIQFEFYRETELYRPVDYGPLVMHGLSVLDRFGTALLNKQTEKERDTMHAEAGDLILVTGDKLAVVRSTEDGLKGERVYHTNEGDFRKRDILAVYQASAVNRVPDTEPTANDRLIEALDRLNAKLGG